MVKLVGSMGPDSYALSVHFVVVSSDVVPPVAACLRCLLICSSVERLFHVSPLWQLGLSSLRSDRHPFGFSRVISNGSNQLYLPPNLVFCLVYSPTRISIFRGSSFCSGYYLSCRLTAQLCLSVLFLLHIAFWLRLSVVFVWVFCWLFGMR